MGNCGVCGDRRSGARDHPVRVREAGAGGLASGARLAPEGRARVKLAGRFADRVRGLLGTKADGSTLVLMPCNDVHTWGMSYPIDVAFLSREGEVIAAYEDVGPGRRMRCGRAVAVLERCSRCAGAWFVVGDRVSVVRSGGECS